MNPKTITYKLPVEPIHNRERVLFQIIWTKVVILRQAYDRKVSFGPDLDDPNESIELLVDLSIFLGFIICILI